MSTLNFGNYDAFAFDFDGTLADTVATHNKARLLAFDLMARETGDERFSQIPQEIHDEAHRHGSNPTAIIGWAMQAAGLVTEITDKKVARTVELKKEAYIELCKEGLEEIPRAVNFLESLNRIIGQPIGITTTAHKVEVMPFVRRYDLGAMISEDKIVTFEDVGAEHMKPDPMAYLITLGRFGLSNTPEKMLVFEDTPGGVSSAKKAGAAVVALFTTHTKADFEESDIKPDFYFENFQQLIDVV